MIGPSGPSNASLLIVMSEPTPQCFQQRKLLSGYLGEHFRDLCMRAGIRLSDARVVSLAETPNQKLHDGGYPNEKFLERRKAVLTEIENIRPRMVVCMGSAAAHAVAGVGRVSKDGFVGIGDWRGSVINRHLADGTTHAVCFVQDVEAVFKDRTLVPFYVSDLQKAVKYSKQPFSPPAYSILLDPPNPTEAISRMLTRGTPISFDIEFYGRRLLCISFCNSEDETLVIKHRGPETLKLVRQVLESGIELRAQNASFDLGVLDYWYGIDAFKNLTFDTMLAAHSAYIELPKDLGTLCSTYTDQPCYWDKSNWKGLESGEWAFDDMMEYCARDSWVTHMVAEAQIKDELTDPAVAQTFAFEMSLLEPLWRMSKRGVRWDQARVNEIQLESAKIAEKNAALLGALHPDLADKHGNLNVRSPKAIASLLYSEFGFKRPTTGKSKSAWPTDDMTLSKMIADAKDPAVANQLRLIRATRKALNMMSKFSGKPDDASSGIQIDEDGRYRCSYNIGGTDTGRLSSNKFAPTGTGSNGQNSPRDKIVRRVFRPDDGWLMAYNDLERAESLVVAKITQDPLMLEHHEPGKNAHRLLGALLYDREPEELTEEQYYMSKQTRHAGNYMQGWKTFQDNVNKHSDKTGIWLSAAEAKRLSGLYREIHVNLQRWWNETQYKIRSTGKLYNLFGRPRQFFNRHDSMLPSAVAFVPQSTVGDAMNYGIVSLSSDEALMQNVQMLMQIHDALVYQVRIPPDLMEGVRRHQAGGASPKLIDELLVQDPRVQRLLINVRNHLLVEVPDGHGGSFIINTETNVSIDSWGECHKVSI